MSWKELPDGSYANSEFPCKLVSEAGVAKLEILAGAVNRKLALDDLWNNPLSPIPASSVPFEIYEERYPTGTNGGTMTALTYNQRPMNHYYNFGHSWAKAPAGGQFEIDPGGAISTFLFFVTTSAYEVGYSFAVLRDVTNSIDLQGETRYGSTGLDVMVTLSSTFGVTLNSAATFELALYPSATKASIGGGPAANLAGFAEIYSRVTVIKTS